MQQNESNKCKEYKVGQNVKIYKGKSAEKIINEQRNNEIIKIEENQVNYHRIGTLAENVKSDNEIINDKKTKDNSIDIRNILYLSQIQ